MNDSQISRAGWRRLIKNARLALAALGATALAACGGSGTAGVTAPGGVSSPTSCTANCGGAVVTLTDAPGDFLSYIVKVVSLQLTRSDGTVVQTLPVTTTVDFSQLVNLSEIVSAAQIPAGRYLSASITLDYAGATIVVDNGTGGVAIAAGNIIDGVTSQALAAPNPTQMTLSLTLPSSAPFVVTPGTVANLALDFNLAASNTIAPSATAPTTVTVSPALAGSLVPDATKQIRVRGALASTDTTAGTFVLNVHPFDDDSGDSGQYTVGTAATTTYTINGTGYTGAAGLTQLAGLATGTMIAAYGSLDRTTMTFTAANVVAGSSVAGTKQDSVAGAVLSRSGNTLTIANGISMRADVYGEMNFVRKLTATVGAGTTVTESGQAGSFTIQDISVGQKVQLSGTLGTDSSGNPTFDATTGSALLIPTLVTGTVAGNAAGTVTIALQALAGQSPSAFTFAGTGATSAQDASASAYTVAVPAALAGSPLMNGTPVSFTGFVAPFGSAPPDFNAVTSLNFANTKAELEMHWATPGETTPFSTLTGSQITVDQAMLTATDEFFMNVAFNRIALTSLTSGLNFVPDAAAVNPQFVIVHRMSQKSESFTTFNDFVTALTTDLNGTVAAVGMAVAGPYAASTSTVSVDQMIVMLND